jgi:hypothetical protein
MMHRSTPLRASLRLLLSTWGMVRSQYFTLGGHRLNAFVCVDVTKLLE